MLEVVALVLLFAFIWFLVSLWVGVDATKNSPHSALLWGLAVFVGGLLGLILYVILGRVEVTDEGGTTSRTGLVECPNCHALEEPDRGLCRLCEEPLDES